MQGRRPEPEEVVTALMAGRDEIWLGKVRTVRILWALVPWMVRKILRRA